jgi:GTP cyclohydrolase I
MEKGFITGRGLDTTRQAIRHLISITGEDPDREGLKDTPDRVIRAYKELFAGYQVDVPALFKEFEVAYDGMVVVGPIPFVSTCEHHLMQFWGHVHVGYIPEGRVVGLSKMARLVDAYARRLQVQERLTRQVAEAMATHLKPKGCGCVVVARHGCMCFRGVQKSEAEMTTDSLFGAFKDDARTRSEFLMSCHRKV